MNDYLQELKATFGKAEENSGKLEAIKAEFHNLEAQLTRDEMKEVEKKVKDLPSYDFYAGIEDEKEKLRYIKKIITLAIATCALATALSFFATVRWFEIFIFVAQLLSILSGVSLIIQASKIHGYISGRLIQMGLSLEAQSEEILRRHEIIKEIYASRPQAQRTTKKKNA